MMGFDEDRGIIPRLCEDLFNQIAQMDKEQVICLGLWTMGKVIFSADPFISVHILLLIQISFVLIALIHGVP